jgi:copper chaperone NosL
MTGGPPMHRRAVLRLLLLAPLVPLTLPPRVRAADGRRRSTGRQPRPVQLIDDRCPACGMAVMDARFAAQAVTDGGRTLVYDAVECMADHRNGHAGPAPTVVAEFLADRSASSHDHAVWCVAEHAVVLHHRRLRTPMGGGLAAFCDEAAARTFAEAQGYGERELMTWHEVLALGIERPWVVAR